MFVRSILWGCLSSLAFPASAQADDAAASHWIARIGVHPIHPQTHDRQEFTADNTAGLSVGATYLLSERWGIEVFSAFPDGVDIHDANKSRAAHFSMIPSSVTLQYHLGRSDARFRAFAGGGFSHARIDNERGKAALDGQSVQIGDSTGLAAVLGLDMKLGSKWFVNLDARWMDIGSSISIGGMSRGVLDLDPVMFGLSVGRELR